MRQMTTRGYDFLIDKWTRAEFNIDYTFPAISPGYTIDGMATLGYTTIDSLPYPPDSPAPTRARQAPCPRRRAGAPGDGPFC